jgi:hypothetical protein
MRAHHRQLEAAAADEADAGTPAVTTGALILAKLGLRFRALCCARIVATAALLCVGGKKWIFEEWGAA